MSRELFPYSLYARQCYLKGSLRKKQLMTSFVEHLKKIHGNIKKHIFWCLFVKFDQKRYTTEHFKGKSSKHLKLIFQSHISKFKIFHTLFYLVINLNLQKKGYRSQK